MEAYQHFAASLIAASPLLITGLSPLQPGRIGLFLLAIACGTLIDLDHFLISRYNHGDWRHFKRALQNPLTVIISNDNIKEGEEELLTQTQRFSSHMIISSTTPLLIMATIGYTAGIVAFTFFALHILLDVSQVASH